MVVVATLVFLGVQIHDGLAELPPLRFDAAAVGAFAFACFANLANVVLYALVWKLLLEAGQTHVSLRTAFFIMARTGIARYIPGNVFQYLGRAALARLQGVPTEPILISFGVETVLAVVAALLVAAVGLVVTAFRTPDTLSGLLEYVPASWLSWGLALAAAVLFVALAATVLPAGRRVLRWAHTRRSYLSPRRSAIILPLIVLDFVVAGICLKLLLATFWNRGDAVGVVELTWGFALAWTFGKLPGAPGGLGIREFILYVLFKGEIGSALAAGLFLLLRLATIVGDCLAFGASYLVRAPAPLNISTVQRTSESAASQ